MARRADRRASVVVIGLASWLWYSATGAAHSGDIARGARVYQRCYSCHTVDPNEKVRLQGPSLYRVVGRRAASAAGFSYSRALMAKGEAGLVWTEDELNRFLGEPESMLPGNQMNFFGLPAYLKDAGQRQR
jgi:cytochrome c